MRFDWSAHSEIGLVRKENQDSGYASDRLLIVADGMGGAARGDLASAVAIDVLQDLDQSVTGDAVLPELERGVDAANDELAGLVRADPELDGMGTTVCGAMLDEDRYGIVHIGDSRGYLLRDGELSRLTTDHSWVQSLIDDGRLTPDEALYHPHRNLLLKVLNGHPNNTPDLFTAPAQAGDRVLFCSDGLCGLVDDHTIGELLANPHRREALQDLIAAAHEAGGHDNITILIGDVVDGDPDLAGAVVLGAAATVEIPAVEPVPVSAETADDDDLPRSQPTPVSDDGDSPVEADSPPADAVADPEDLRYAPTRRPRRRWLAWVCGLVGVLLVVGGGSALGYQQLRSRYYVGAQGNQVAIYRGVPEKVGPFTVSSLQEQTRTSVYDLPPRYQEDVLQHTYQNQSLTSARNTVTGLAEKAAACKKAREERARATASPTPSPTPSPSPSDSATPEAPPSGETPTATPTATPTPTAIPTPPPAPTEC